MGYSKIFFHYCNTCPGVLMLYKWCISDIKNLEQPKCRSLSSLTTTSVATESESAPSDTNIGWAVECKASLSLSVTAGIGANVPGPDPGRCSTGDADSRSSHRWCNRMAPKRNHHPGIKKKYCMFVIQKKLGTELMVVRMPRLQNPLSSPSLFKDSKSPVG